MKPLEGAGRPAMAHPSQHLPISAMASCVCAGNDETAGDAYMEIIVAAQYVAF